MANPKTPILLLLLPLLLSTLTPTTSFTPSDFYFFNSGSSITTAINNCKFIGDSSKFAYPFLPSSPSIAVRDQNLIPHPLHLYQTARVFTKLANYVFKINKPGTQVVRLHFHPFNASNLDLSTAQFHVSANGVLLLNNFTPKTDHSDSYSPNSSPVKEYFIWVDSGEIAISFLPVNFAFVNAIEVFSAPNDLIVDVAKYVDDEKVVDVNRLTRKAIEMVYRVNVGGFKVTPFNDTLWRTWVTDDGFLKANADAKAVHFSGPVKYQNGGLSREVGPDNLYNSARVMKKDENMTWVFNVSSGYKYLVRTHFCDIASKALGEIYFNVYINGYLAVENMDLSALATQMLAAPYYADFVVNGDSSGVLNVSVGPSKMSEGYPVKAILNGIEVMKMSNSMNSLDGEISSDLLLKSSEKGSTGFLMPLVVVSLVMAACMFVHKKRTAVKETLGWSPLPVEESGGR